MKYFYILLIFLFGTSYSRAQLAILFQAPPTGFTYKPQLWNMVLTNTGSSSINLHIEFTMNAINSGQQVLSGISKLLTITPGTTQVNASHVMPVQYSIPPSIYTIDNNPMGLLPLGEFEVCYYFFKHGGDGVTQVAEQCQDVRIEVLNPPQLIYPYDQSEIPENHPQFNWLPPVPVQLFSSLSYDLNLVEVLPNQSAADAVQQNMPLYQGLNLSTNSMLYPGSAPTLEVGKFYAWKIAAKSNNAVVGISETWQFTLKQYNTLSPSAPLRQPYISLRKSPETAYAIFINEVKFSYFNETADTSWSAKVIDLSGNRTEKALQMDSLPLKHGTNLVNYDARSDPFFINHHIYQLEVLNSRKEIWTVRFEFIKPEDTNH